MFVEIEVLANHNAERSAGLCHSYVAHSLADLISPRTLPYRRSLTLFRNVGSKSSSRHQLLKT
jgi:hypothetical protein